MTTLASDDFNRANGNDLNSSNWSKQTNSDVSNLLKIATNQATNNTDSADTAYNYNAVTWPNDQWGQADITANTGYSLQDGPAIGLRMSTSALTYYRNCITHITGGNNISMDKVVAGATTQIGARNSGAWTDGATLYFEVQGTTLITKLSGTQVGTSATDSAISSGRVGIGYSAEGASKVATWDNWSGGDFASSGLPPGLGPGMEMEMFSQSFVSAMMR